MVFWERSRRAASTTQQTLVVKIQENERKKLGAELHDTAAQDIKALKLFLGRVGGLLPTDKKGRGWSEVHPNYWTL